MTKQLRQFEYEKMWAQAFLDKINRDFGCDYIAHKYDNKQSNQLADIDIEGISSSSKFSSLYLQLTTDVRLNRIVLSGKYRAPIFNCNNILQAITEKIKKYTKNQKDFSRIILLIQGTITESSIPFVFTDNLIKQCNNYQFKGIYYISSLNRVTHDWFIKELKETTFK